MSRPRYHAQGIPAILNAIRSAADTRATDAGTVELITEGVNLLAAIASNQECRPLIMQHGGIEITLQVMRFYIDFPLIQERGRTWEAGEIWLERGVLERLGWYVNDLT